MPATAPFDAFRVPLGMHLLSGFVNRFRGLWIRLGNLETAALREELEAVAIDRPVYVSGLARAGTTILLEWLAQHPQVATHRYSDFPGLFVPTWWNRGAERCKAAPRERAHGDRIKVTPDSPEAMEECLWMAFFCNAHRPDASDVLDADTLNPAFERFYRDHIRKLLAARNRSRYVAKGNYNLTRLTYLQKLLPSARFVVAIRDPRDHVASLMKQHRLFTAGEQAHPRALAYMQRVGHFEFGLDRRPIDVGDGVAQQVANLWRRGEEVRGCARHWASLYSWLLDKLIDDEPLRQATRIVCYERLCADPSDVTQQLAEHCELPSTAAQQRFAETIAAPARAAELSANDRQIILQEAGRVADRWKSAFSEIPWDLS